MSYAKIIMPIETNVNLNAKLKLRLFELCDENAVDKKSLITFMNLIKSVCPRWWRCINMLGENLILELYGYEGIQDRIIIECLKNNRIIIYKHEISKIPSPDKIIIPDDSVSKRGTIGKLRPWMIKNLPQSEVKFLTKKDPQGNCLKSQYLPDLITTVENREIRERLLYLCADWWGEEPDGCAYKTFIEFLPLVKFPKDHSLMSGDGSLSVEIDRDNYTKNFEIEFMHGGVIIVYYDDGKNNGIRKRFNSNKAVLKYLAKTIPTRFIKIKP